jgi:hypothetical protein
VDASDTSLTIPVDGCPMGVKRCKTRVDVFSYRNVKSRVDAPGTSELILLDSKIKYWLKGDRIKTCVVWWSTMWFELMYEFVYKYVGIRLIWLCYACVYSICYDLISNDRFSWLKW